MRVVTSPLVALCLATLASCGLDTGVVVPPGDATTVDSGSAVDGGMTDGTTVDTGRPDSRVMDAGAEDSSRDAAPTDATLPDSGAFDTGTLDTGAPDTGAPDTGTPDTGTPDTGTPDTGTPDTGMPDTGPACTPMTEICNATDDDCDSLIDEGACPGCTPSTHGTSVYLACSGTRRTQRAARTDCMARGYDLVVIDDAAENAHVRAEAASFGADFWIGMDDRDSEATYRWVDGRIVRQGGTDRLYTNWQPREPDDDGGSDCVEMDSTDATWNDVPCDEEKRYVCEAPL